MWFNTRVWLLCSKGGCHLREHVQIEHQFPSAAPAREHVNTQSVCALWLIRHVALGRGTAPNALHMFRIGPEVVVPRLNHPVTHRNPVVPRHLIAGPNLSDVWYFVLGVQDGKNPVVPIGSLWIT